jgi:hypothetical protein
MGWRELIPGRVRLGGTTYRLSLEDKTFQDEHAAYGMVNYETFVVHVVAEQPPSEVLNTLIHELSHVIWREYGLPKRPTEERAVTALGTGWSALLHQNPALLEVMSELRRAGEDCP